MLFMNKNQEKTKKNAYIMNFNYDSYSGILTEENKKIYQIIFVHFLTILSLRKFSFFKRNNKFNYGSKMVLIIMMELSLKKHLDVRH